MFGKQSSIVFKTSTLGWRPEEPEDAQVYELVGVSRDKILVISKFGKWQQTVQKMNGQAGWMTFLFIEIPLLQAARLEIMAEYQRSTT